MDAVNHDQKCCADTALRPNKTRVDIAEIERLSQFWKAGLLGDDEFLKAVSAPLDTDVETDTILWEHICDSVPVPRD
jgi:hypothetical protein